MRHMPENKTKGEQSSRTTVKKNNRRTMTVVAADIMGPLPRLKEKNQYILVCVDMFTKWVEIIPVKKK